MSNIDDRLWGQLVRQLDRIETTVETIRTKQADKVDNATFKEALNELEERMEKLEISQSDLKDAAITPDQVSHMIGKGLQDSEARGLTARDRWIRYGLAALSLGTFVLLITDKLGHG